MIQFLWGANATLCIVAALFFAKFWRRTRDALFLAFAAGFGALAAHWVGLGLLEPGRETRHYHYLLRLLAFTLIVVGVLVKNRSRLRP